MPKPIFNPLSAKFDYVSVPGDILYDPFTEQIDTNYFGIARLYAKIIIVNAAGSADYTTISAAITAATALSPASDNLIAILVYPGSYTENWTLPAYVSLIGFKGVKCYTSGTEGPAFIFQGYNTVSDIIFYPVYITTKYLIKITGTGVILKNISADSWAGYNTTNHYVVWSATGNLAHTLEMENCYFYMRSAGNPSVTTAYAFYGETASARTLTIRGCTFRSARIAGTGSYIGYYQGYVAGASTIVDSVFMGTSGSIVANDARLTGCSFQGAVSSGVAALDDTTIRQGRTHTGLVTTLSPTAATDKVLILKGASSQSANLQEWQNSSAGVLAYVDASGNLTLRGNIHIDGDITNYTSQVIDIGYEQTSDKRGYGNDYISDKVINYCTIGGGADDDEGAVRVVDGVFQIYANGVWNDVVINFVLREDSSGSYEFEHTPVGFEWYYEIMSGNSDILGLDGRPVIQQYSSSMGAYQRDLQLDGGSF